MRAIGKITRRAMLAGQAAMATVAAFTSGAFAAGRPADNPGATGPTRRLPLRWNDATAAELEPLIGERFRVRSHSDGDLVMQLVELEAVPMGDARPASLARRQGVTAVFRSPDDAALVRDGYGVYRVSHRSMGAADLYMTAVPRRSGGHDLEIVLN